ncbi:cyclic peptide export ABC transporter [Merismopedia glauca]|uniref:ABC transporter ATP-binding protein n=1 Tax=Merismopedia glauca CCAP 1448/3 TaxID=1296344 RepID=A0A2T1C327_9CYAN|nr:cyclic peptide export ABC transporter [Merismopedia glauca]PSB02588.1 ABC transporter ATP-binding protein [Merismopedia glauca CCAP 1448/3]
MNLIWLLLKASWINVAIASFTGLISGACSARLIALINNALNETNTPSITLVRSFILLALVGLVTSVISQILLIRLSENTMFNLRMRLSKWILASPLRHLEELGANRLLATLTDDVQSVSSTVFVIPTFCIDIAIILGCLIYLGWLSKIVFLLTFLFMVVAIFSVQIFLNIARKYLAVAREEQDNLFKHFRSLTEGIKELKINADRQADFLNSEFKPTAISYRDYSISSLNTLSLAFGWGQILIFTIIGLLLFLVPNNFDISKPVLSGYILTIIYLVQPFTDILRLLPNLNRAAVALNKIDTLGLSLAANLEANSASITPKITDWQEWKLSGVTHQYRGEQADHRFILGPIDLSFVPGELVFIVGGNGSGKSTLAKLLVGLYIPESGNIYLDDREISDRNRDWYRQHFSVVFYDFYLFERLLGVSHHNLDTQAQAYLTKLQLENKVTVKEGTLSSIALSQGQRKRLALLTAYLEERPIYLFDEWASDQDPFFKEVFYQQLLPDLKQRGKTVIVISHDDRYFHLGDRLIKLDYGKIEYNRLINK